MALEPDVERPVDAIGKAAAEPLESLFEQSLRKEGQDKAKRTRNQLSPIVGPAWYYTLEPAEEQPHLF